MEEQGFIKNIDIPTAIKDAQAKGIKSEFVKWNEDKIDVEIGSVILLAEIIYNESLSYLSCSFDE